MDQSGKNKAGRGLLLLVPNLLYPNFAFYLTQFGPAWFRISLSADERNALSIAILAFSAIAAAAIYFISAKDLNRYATILIAAILPFAIAPLATAFGFLLITSASSRTSYTVEAIFFLAMLAFMIGAPLLIPLSISNFIVVRKVRAKQYQKASH